jgi:hypothetical protein
VRKPSKRLIAAGAMALFAAPTAAFACACGCGVFEVGGPLMMPTMSSTVFSEYDFLDQTENWSGTSGAPPANNDDKRITSDFLVVGGQYAVSEDWSLEAELPVTGRSFATDNGMGGIARYRHDGIGDIRLMGIYDGLTDDMSTAIIAGVKLPTGDFKYPGLDRDTSLGSGSTDLLLGFTHSGQFSFTSDWGWYAQALWQKTLLSQDGYKPGSEVDAALGLSYGGWTVGGVNVSPIVQVLFAYRLRDGGPNADPDNTGYNRILLSPGVEASLNNWHLYGDVEFPTYQDMNGNQLVAHQAYKVELSYSFN